MERIGGGRLDRPADSVHRREGIYLGAARAAGSAPAANAVAATTTAASAASATTAAVAATAAASAVPTATAAARSTAAAARTPGLRLVHAQRSSLELLSIQRGDGRLCVRVGPHLDEGEPSWAACLAIRDDGYVRHLASVRLERGS